MEDLKYPIKYAILPVEEQVGHNYMGWGEPVYDVCGYIVSKAYLVGETLEYLRDGTSKKSYQVVFPFPYPVLKGLSRRITPEKNACGNYSDAFDMPEVFENFEKAKKLTDMLNTELENKYLSRVSLIKPDWKEQYKKIQEEFVSRMNCYEHYEQEILKETEDMIIQTGENDTKLFTKILKGI